MTTAHYKQLIAVDLKQVPFFETNDKTHSFVNAHF